MSLVGKWASAFGRFWWEFLIGDTPELFVAVLLVIGLAFLLHHAHAVGIVVVIAVGLCCLALSTWRGRKRA
ncbi:MAG: hypothetical protein ACYCSF_07250 [Acidimicrobiales bacterium]